MDVKKVRREGKYAVYEVRIKLDESKSMLDQEMAIQEAVNAVGCEATKDALKNFDTSGNPLMVNGIKYTGKGLQNEDYECPYGRISVNRQVYQNSRGGRIFCPMENAARIISSATPKFAKLLSYKYGNSGCREAAQDLMESTGRAICTAYIQTVSEMVGSVAQFLEPEDIYELPKAIAAPAQVAISLDGTCMLMVKDGWREAMTGTISLYDAAGERIHTIYVGAAPEHGKGEFTARFEREIQLVKEKYPDTEYIGLADGAATNWEFLKKYTNKSILDFYHASEYVKLAANAMFPGEKKQNIKKEWIENSLHNLKHKNGAAKQLLNEFIAHSQKTPKYYRTDMESAITYFTNHYRKMNYAQQTKMNMPIGSGVVEAACKELIKQRMANSGMRWKEKGASIVISIRSLILSGKRWGQFWKKISESGCPAHREFAEIK